MAKQNSEEPSQEIQKQEEYPAWRIAKKIILILEVPLLFESGIDRYTDWTVVVKASQKQQVKRAVKRSSMTKQEALNRIKSQMPLSEKVRLADIIIDNGKTLNQTQKQVNKIWLKLPEKIKK